MLAINLVRKECVNDGELVVGWCDASLECGDVLDCFYGWGW